MLTNTDPEKLKTWKPEMVHGLAVTRISDFQKSSFSPTPPAPGEGVPAPSPVRHSCSLLHGLVDQIRRTGRRLL